MSAETMASGRRLKWGAVRAAMVACALCLPPSIQAADIYRWVDEGGRTHVSDVVPQKYRKSAIRIDSTRSEISTEQRQQAERAAARNKAIVEEDDLRRRRAQAIQAAAAPSAPLAAKRPNQGVTDSTDCTTWRSLYRESMECFAPFRTVNGSTKAEAFEKCNPIPSPELKCGPISE